MGQLFHVP